MRHAWGVVAVCVWLAAPVSAQTPGASVDPGALEPVGRLSEGIQTRDAKLVTSAFADDAVIMPPNGGPITGRAAIEAFWTKQFEQGLNALEGGSNGCRTSGDLGYEWGTASLESRASGSLAVDSVKYVNVLKKDATGAWKIAVNIWNSSLPPPK